MTLQLHTAERKQAKLRIGVSAPSGAGKTMSSLLIARGLSDDWSKVALIDTENGSGELYSHMGKYSVITLEAPFTPERYIEAIELCQNAGMQAIVVDSVSHEWDGKGGCLQANETLANAKFRGNTWAAWSETTPRHQAFLQAILTSPCHIVTTARSKTDMIMTEDKKIKKVGMKDIQREGFEYEMTVQFNLDRDSHMANVSKDRTELFEGHDPFIITEETGEKLKDWGESGKDVRAELVARFFELSEKAGKKRTDKAEGYVRQQSDAWIATAIQKYEDADAEIPIVKSEKVKA